MNQADMHPRVAVNGICLMHHSLAEQAKCWRQLAARRVSFVGLQIEREGLAAAKAALATGAYAVETVVHPYMVGQHLNPDRGRWGQGSPGCSNRCRLRAGRSVDLHDHRWPR